jgi:hypothetical protein
MTEQLEKMVIPCANKTCDAWGHMCVVIDIYNSVLDLLKFPKQSLP